MTALYETASKQLNPIKAVQASFVAAAAGNYDDNDVISNSASNGLGVALEFANAVRITGGAGKVVGGSVNVIAATSVAATMGVQLFSQTPTATELDDAAAEGGVGAADAPYYLGEILFAAGTDYGAGTIKYPATLTPAAPLLVYAVAKSLFARVLMRDAETNETAGMTVVVTLWIE